MVVKRAFLSWVLLVILPFPALAYHLPIWELGVGVGGLNLPAYRGAKGRVSYLIPYPHIIYRGDAVRMDEDGMRGRLFESDRLNLDLSLAGNIPVPEVHDGAREGMPDLDPVGEFGPTLDIAFLRHGKRHEGESSIWLRLPMRAAMSVGDPLIESQGWFFSPYLDLSYRKGATRSFWKMSLALGPLYASRRYHEYFYKVSKKYETPEREAYQPDGGYSGSRATLSLVVNSKKWFFGVFARYDWLNGAVFEDSPLVEIKEYFAVGFAVSRIISTSAEKVSH
jgi:outer membrane scaffolding protein for murein synthesis (MipA/OmpV family)